MGSFPIGLGNGHVVRAERGEVHRLMTVGAGVEFVFFFDLAQRHKKHLAASVQTLPASGTPPLPRPCPQRRARAGRSPEQTSLRLQIVLNVVIVLILVRVKRRRVRRRPQRLRDPPDPRRCSRRSRSTPSDRRAGRPIRPPCLPARRPAPRAIGVGGIRGKFHAADQSANVADLFCQLCHFFTSAPQGQLRYRKWVGKARRPQSADKCLQPQKSL